MDKDKWAKSTDRTYLFCLPDSKKREGEGPFGVPPSARVLSPARKNFCSGDVACPRRCPEGRDGAVFPAWARKGTREEKLEGRSMVSGFFRGGHREKARPDISIHSRPIRRLSFSRCDAGSTDKDSNVLRGKTAHESAVAIRKPAGAGNGYRLRDRRIGGVRIAPP